MKHLRNFDSYIKESAEDELVWTAVVDKTGIFYEPKKKLKSELDKQKDKLPYFKTYKECNDWCEFQNEEMFQDRNR